MNTDERAPATQQQIEAVATEIHRLSTKVHPARREAKYDNHWVAKLRGTIALYRFILKFRGVGGTYEFWPIGIITIAPFTVATVLWVVSFALNFRVISSAISVLVGALTAGAVCVHLLWRPTTPEIQRRLTGVQADLVVAEAILQQSTARFQAIEAQYLLAKERHRILAEELARYQTRQAQLQREKERQQELKRQRWLQSLQYKRQQLYERNWKAMRSVEFEQFLEEVFRTLGYQVETTRVTGDQGVDLIVSAHGRRIAIQVKGYHNSVSNSAIQEAHTGMAYYGCDACAVITNSRFTPSAKELAGKVGCFLIDEDCMQAFSMGQVQL